MDESMSRALEVCKSLPYRDWRVELLAVVDQKLDLYKRLLPQMYRESSAHTMGVQDALMRLMRLRAAVGSASYGEAFEVLRVCDRVDDDIYRWFDYREYRE